MEQKELELLEKHIKENKEFYKNYHYTARWMTLGSSVVVKASVCHSGLSSQSNPDGRFAVVNGFQTDYSGMNGDGRWEDTSNEDKYLYLDWLLNRSPYADGFLTKSAAQALNQGYTISTAYVPSNLMAAGLVASRRMWEYTYILRVWVDLVKAGVNENLAYYLAHLAQCKVINPDKINWNDAKYGHCSIDSHVWTGKCLKNFINNKPISLNKNYSQCKNYDGYGRMFSGAKYGEPLNTWIRKNFPYKDEKKMENSNPFAKAIINEPLQSISYGVGIKRMALFANKIMEKINA